MAIRIPRGAFIYITLFLVLSLPFFLAFLPASFQDTEFSIYNDGWNGVSEFRALIEESDNSITVKTLLGSTNALNRLNISSGADAGTLVIMGPKVRYDPTESIAILLYVVKGGRVLLADDFGTGNDILSFFSVLLEALANTDLGGAGNAFGFDPDSLGGIGAQNSNESSSSGFPIIGIAINQSVLIDTKNFYKSAVQPVFTPPPTAGLEGTTYTAIAPWLEPMIEGVNEVIGNYAATISMKVKYPTEFVDSGGNNITIDTWVGLPNCELVGSAVDCQDNYTPSVFEVLWVPMGDFPVSISEVAGITLPDTYEFSLKLSALYSSQESWLEANTTAAKNVENISPDPSEWGNVEFPVAIHFPLGTGENAGSLTIISDPSIFINRYIKEDRFDSCTDEAITIGFTRDCEKDPDFDPANYDNRVFSNNIIKMLTGDRPGSIVYFDEGHLAQSYTNPALYMGTFFRFLDLISMFPLLSPILPITVLGLARRYAPKGKKAGAPLLKTKVDTFYGRSFFAVKMRWFLEYHHYTRGIELIHRKIKRDLIKRYKLPDWSPEIVETMLRKEYPHLRSNMLKKLQEIESIVEQSIFIDEDKFMELYLTLKEIQDFIGH